MLLLVPATGLLTPAPAAAESPAAASRPTSDQIREWRQDLAGWALEWDDARGVLRRGAGRLRSAASPAAGRSFLAAHAALLGADPADLVLEDVRATGRLRHHHYGQQWSGIPIEGARVRLTFGRSGELLYFASRLVPDLSPPALTPTISPQAARDLALSGLPPAAATEWFETELVILPRARSQLPDDRLAWRLRCSTERPRGGWRLLVDAHSGEVLERHSLRYGEARRSGETRRRGETIAAADTRLYGEVQGRIPTPTPWNEPVIVALPNLAIAAFEEDVLLDERFTEADGTFDFGILPGDAPAVRTVLAGRFASVHQGNQATPPDTLWTADPQSPVSVLWDSTTAALTAISAYVHINRAHDYLKEVDAAFPRDSVDGAPWLDRVLPVIVDDPFDSCNAYALIVPESPEVHFLIGGEPCAPTAQIADVAYHEYAHLVTLYAYLPYWAPGHLHEAFSDYFAASLNDTSLIGMGFFGPGTHLRDVDHELIEPVGYPCNVNPYCYGSLLSGALWRIRRALIDQLPSREMAVRLADSLFHYSRYGKPFDFQEMLIEMLLVDDDDGDLSNGTPHLDAIASGFAYHNIADFSVRIFHAPLPDIEDSTVAREVAATLWSIYPIAPETVRLLYSVDGGAFHDLPMEADGAEYRATIPAQPSGSRVRYYLVAADTQGHGAAVPEGAPAETFSYRIGRDTEAPSISHTPPSSVPSEQQELWLSARIADNCDGLSAAYVDLTVEHAGGQQVSRWPLTPKASAPADSALAGLFEARLEPGTLLPGDHVGYALHAVDAAADSNRARFPTTGEITFEVVVGRGWDFEEDSGALLPEGDWEWGTPVGTLPPLETSGTHLLGTALTGVHAPARISTLTSEPLDLGNWEEATLEFASWYRTEAEYDGGWIEVSRDQGQTWELVTPLDGYPGHIQYDADWDLTYEEIHPAFTGDGGRWQRVQVCLDAFAGETIQVRLFYVSDWAVADLGWYVDDLKLIARHLQAPPGALTASQGEDGRVTLAWDAPAGAEGDPDLLGYRIYRGLAPGDLLPEPLAETAVAPRSWIDTDVLNGVRYYYAVAALFESAESPLSNEAIGFPYRAEADAPYAVERTLYDTTSGRDTVYIANSGTGRLTLDFYHADPGQPWEGLRAICDLIDVTGPAFRTLGSDPADGGAPDLRRLACRRIDENLLFRIGLHDTLPDPRTAFTMFLYLDTDLSVGSGRTSGNVGAEYVVVIGQRAYALFGLPAYVAGSELEPVDHVSAHIVQQGLDSLEVGVALQTLAWPEQIACALEVAAADSSSAAVTLAGRSATGDRLPDAPLSAWLNLPTSGHADEDEPYPLVLSYDFADHPQDELAALLFLVTNDADQPLLELPITIHRAGAAIQGEFWLEPARPTPFRSTTALRLHLPAGEIWRLDIIDVAGRRVRRLGSFSSTAPGIRLVSWDGRGDDGRYLGQGVYYAVARCGRHTVSRPLVMIR